MRPVKLFRSVMAKLGLNGESQDPKDLARIRFKCKYMGTSCYEYTYAYIYIYNTCIELCIICIQIPIQAVFVYAYTILYARVYMCECVYVLVF